MIEIIFQELLHTIVKFLYAPVLFPKMLWILMPVVLAILLMEIYFWNYPRLNIDYHKSMENTIFLLFISFDLLRVIALDGINNPVKIYLCMGFMIFTLVVAILDFYHKLPMSLLGKLSSKTVIAFLSYVIVVIVYSDMLEIVTVLSVVYILLSVVLFFILILLIRRIFLILEPKSYEEIDSFLEVIEKDLKKAIDDSKNDLSGAEKKAPDVKKEKRSKKNHPK